LTVGAHPSNDLVLADSGVSGFHAELSIDGRGFVVEDHNSANGTYIDDVSIARAYLRPGQKLRLGQSVLELRDEGEEVDLEISDEDFFGDLVGRSVAMRELFALARKAAGASVTLLIQGETGTGKDLLARAIHKHSARSARPFEVFDCGAVAANLIESALFGHVKGAFTGAASDHPGVFERANGGTVFLDEIGELDPALQPKLLRVLENGTITRVGGTEEVAVDVRVIAATHRDLSAEVDGGRFRSDLYFRLAVLVLRVPALRERVEDIPLLASYFLRDLLAHDEAEARLLRSHMDEAFERLKQHPWPGNVRELRNVIERSAVLADPAELDKDLFSRLVELRKSIGTSIHVKQPLKIAREQFDVGYLRDVLDQTGGDVAEAARIADVHPKSFTRLLRRYRLSRTGEPIDE
jgi:DNA-binding NtrC family response regulator